jgi:hypothetical protein
MSILPSNTLTTVILSFLTGFNLMAVEFTANVDFEASPSTTTKYRINTAVASGSLVTSEQLNQGSSNATWNELGIVADSAQDQGYFVSSYTGTAASGVTMDGNWLLMGGYGETTIASDESKQTTVTLVLDKEICLDSNFSLSMDLAMIISTSQTGYMVIIGKDSTGSELFRVLCPNGDYPTDHRLYYKFATIKSDLSIDNETIEILSGSSGEETRDSKLKMIGSTTGYTLNMRNFDDSKTDAITGSFFATDKALAKIEFRCVASKCEWGIDNIEVKGDEVVTPVIDLQVEQKGNVVSWSLSQEIGVICYRLIDKDGTVIAQIMADGKASYQVELSTFTKVRLVVVDKYGSEVYIPQDGNLITTPYNLEKGWNLIAMTGEHTDITPLKQITHSKLWTWSGVCYEEVVEPKATQAVWVNSDFKTQIELIGERADCKITLKPGWNMVGPTTDTFCPKCAESAYSWNKKYKKILKSEDVLMRGVGYWIFSLR